jgi:serine/threonine-protein kinase HSL1 (negative regulator of Swe1 kinase)
MTNTIRSNPRSRAHANTEALRLKLGKPESPTKYIQGEARKVSMELGKVMEEAFNRSSVSSSIRSGTDAHQNASSYGSPLAYSPNTQNSGGSIPATTPTAKILSRERPLPPIPAETPNTFVQRKLAETRAEIARRLMEDDSTERFSDILEHLDRLMVPVANVGKRAVSAPTRSPDRAPLHVIPEEVKTDNGEGLGNQVPSYRVFTDPVRSQGHRVAPDQQQTIRIVNGSPTRVAPLNIRKRSGASLNSTKTIKKTNAVPLCASNGNSTVRPYEDLENDPPVAQPNNHIAVPEDQNTVIRKKKSWFRLNTNEKKRNHDEKENQIKKKQSHGLLKIPEAWHSLDDRIKNNSVPLTNVGSLRHNQKQSDGSSGSEFPMRNNKSGASKGDSATRKGLLALFGKKSKNEKGSNPMELGGKRRNTFMFINLLTLLQLSTLVPLPSCRTSI